MNSMEFWKKRITEAKRSNKMHYSVYLAGDVLWNRIYKAHKKVIESLIKPGDKVLDAGCGYGRMSPLFDNYLGIDFSEDFIKEAQQLYPDKHFEVQDLNKLPYVSQSFDWAIVISIKNMIIGNMGEEAWLPMEKELKRVCKKVLILEYGEMEDYTDTDDQMAKHEII